MKEQNLVKSTYEQNELQESVELIIKKIEGLEIDLNNTCALLSQALSVKEIAEFELGEKIKAHLSDVGYFS